MTTKTELKVGFSTSPFADLVAGYGRVLYTRTGFPHLFERAGQSGEHHFDRNWLYIPSHYLQMIRDQASGDGSRVGLIWADPILCDDQPVFPLAYKGEIVAALSSDTARLPEFSVSELSCVQAWCEGRNEDTIEQVREQSSVFIRELFQRDNSPQQFMKRALGLLTNGWPRSCAGIYDEFQGTYHLRMATGDMSRWFRLTQQIHPDLAMRCLEAMYRQEYFIPADTVEDYPAFLDMMPDFLFIHEALLSHRNKRFILATGPGALTPRAAIRLLEFCRLISGLQEFQFASGSELLANFSTLAARGTNSQSLEQVLSDLWGWLSQQISLSRLAVILQQGTDSWGQATIIQRRQDGESQLERLDVAIPEHISARLREGERHIVQDIRSGELSDLLAKERYVRHVLSEAYLPLKSPGGIGGIVLFGAPTAGDYLEEEGELLQSVAAYIALWLQLHGLEKAGWTNSEMCSMMRADEV